MAGTRVVGRESRQLDAGGEIVRTGRADLSEREGTRSIAAVGADLMVGKLSMMPSGVAMVRDNTKTMEENFMLELCVFG